METVRVLTQRKLNQTREEYRYLYVHDALTGLYNRYGFNNQLDLAFADCSRQGMALIILDIDNFKGVNDQYGHTNGDIVLREIAGMLKQQVNDHGAVCRWGGEEFAILLNSDHDVEKLEGCLCQSIRNDAISVNEQIIKVTVSIGACAYDGHGELNIGDLVRAADQCLYEAKNAGKDCFRIRRFFKESTEQGIDRR